MSLLPPHRGEEDTQAAPAEDVELDLDPRTGERWRTLPRLALFHAKLHGMVHWRPVYLATHIMCRCLVWMLIFIVDVPSTVSCAVVLHLLTTVVVRAWVITRKCFSYGWPHTDFSRLRDVNVLCAKVSSVVWVLAAMGMMFINTDDERAPVRVFVATLLSASDPLVWTPVKEILYPYRTDPKGLLTPCSFATSAT